MSSDGGRWKKVDRIFSEALDLAPEDRERFVDGECAGDRALAEEVRALLRLTGDPDFLESEGERGSIEALAAEIAEPTDDGGPLPDPLVGTTIGQYSVLRVLGRGGMGTVYLAERTTGFEQRVALKTIRRGVDTDDVVRRFLAERQILAQLQHPNIAKLFDGGTTGDGRPYFVMELVHGEPITVYADTRKLGIEARLELMRTAAAAVEHAHRHLVVHRDLKPSNVLVTDDGEVKLLDFGIARLIGTEHQWGRTKTSTGLRLLTPAYAAPEQVARGPATTATDVYQLSALLYELLSGARPFPTDLPEQELERHILKIDPEPVSKAVRRATADVASRRGLSSSDELARKLRGDLDVIAAKGLSKEPERRYRSVERLARDIDHHLHGRPVSARPATVRYRLGRFARRNPWFVPGMAAAALVLVLFVGTIVRHNRALSAESELARAEAERAEAVTAFVTGLFRSPNPWSGGESADITVLEALENGASRVEIEFADRPDLQARLFDVIGDSYFGLNQATEAAALQQRALELRRELADAAPLEIAWAERALGVTAYTAAGADSALTMLEPLLATLEGGVGQGERLLYAQVLGDIAWVHWQSSAFDTALAVYDRAEAAFRGLDPPDPLRHGIVLRRHARALGQADRVSEQLPIAEEAVSLLEAVLPRGHIELAAARADLAAGLSNVGRPEDALRVFDEALPVFESRLESDDVNLLTVVNNRAYALHMAGRLAEAEAEYRSLAETYLASDPTAANLGGALQNLAGVLRDQGRLDEAVATSLEAHAVFERQLGVHHLTAFPLLTIAEIELGRGQWAEGLRLSSDAYDILSQTLPAAHYATWVARCRRGRGRWGSGRRAEGLGDLRAASAALDASTLEPDHEYVQECRDALRKALEQAG